MIFIQSRPSHTRAEKAPLAHRTAGICLRLFLFLLILRPFVPYTASAAVLKVTVPKMTAVCTGTSVRLSWKKKSSLSGFRIYLTNRKGTTRKIVKTLTKSSCKITGLGKGKTYYFSLRGYRKVGGKRRWTAFGKPVKVLVPADLPPTGASKATIKQLLQVALQPVGSTMYVWGGGWNEEDTAAGTEARSIGISPRWKSFFLSQDASYDYNNTRYQIHDGLDCSGYVGWVIYNIMEKTDGNEGYVLYAQQMAQNYADRGWGDYISRQEVCDYKAGDIMSSACDDCGHVWIVVGPCSDGSVLLLHASPPGVHLAGTPTPSGENASEAWRLASTCMRKYFPQWFAQYPECLVSSSYLSHYCQMRWSLSDTSVLSDPDGYRDKNAGEIIRDLFS